MLLAAVGVSKMLRASAIPVQLIPFSGTVQGVPNEDTDGGDDRNLYRLEVHFANTGAFRGIYPDDVSTKLAQFSAAPTIPLILKGEEVVDAVGSNLRPVD